MIPNCINRPFIGLRHSCDESSASGLFINDLTGMKLGLLSALANEEKQRGEEYFRSIEENAINSVITDFLNELYKEFNFIDIVSENHITGNFTEIQDQYEYIGYEIKRCYDRLIGVEIQSISFFSDKKFLTSVIVEGDGLRLFKKDITVQKGENLINIDVSGQYDTMKVYFKNCDAVILGLSGCSCGCPSNCSGCAEVRPYGINGDDKTYLKINPFKIDIVCRCSFDNVICNFKKDLAEAIRIKCGILILRELLFTDKYGKFITNSKEEATILLLMFEGNIEKIGKSGYDESSEYYKNLILPVRKAITYLKNTRSKCIECRDTKILNVCFN